MCYGFQPTGPNCQWPLVYCEGCGTILSLEDFFLVYPFSIHLINLNFRLIESQYYYHYHNINWSLQCMFWLLYSQLNTLFIIRLINRKTLFKLLIYLQWQQTKLFIGFDSMVKNYPTWNVDNVSKKLKKPAHHVCTSW